MIPGAAGQVLSDVSVDEPGAAGLEINIGVADIRFSFAKGLHLGAVKDEAGFKFFEKLEVVGGGTVLRHDLLGGFAAFLGFLRGLRHKPQ